MDLACVSPFIMDDSPLVDVLDTILGTSGILDTTVDTSDGVNSFLDFFDVAGAVSMSFSLALGIDASLASSILILTLLFGIVPGVGSTAGMDARDANKGILTVSLGICCESCVLGVDALLDCDALEGIEKEDAGCANGLGFVDILRVFGLS